MLDLLKFQRTFIKNILRPEINMAALSLPRGNGKSALAGYLGSRIMTVGDSLFRSGTESVIVAGSLEQARIIFQVCEGYPWARQPRLPLRGFPHSRSDCSQAYSYCATGTVKQS